MRVCTSAIWLWIAMSFRGDAMYLGSKERSADNTDPIVGGRCQSTQQSQWRESGRGRGSYQARGNT